MAATPWLSCVPHSPSNTPCNLATDFDYKGWSFCRHSKYDFKLWWSNRLLEWTRNLPPSRIGNLFQRRLWRLRPVGLRRLAPEHSRFQVRFRIHQWLLSVNSSVKSNKYMLSLIISKRMNYDLILNCLTKLDELSNWLSIGDRILFEHGRDSCSPW